MCLSVHPDAYTWISLSRAWFARLRENAAYVRIPPLLFFLVLLAPQNRRFEVGQYWLLTDSIRVALTCCSPADQKNSTANKIIYL